MRRGILSFPAALFLAVFCLLPAGLVHAGGVGVPISLSVDPASVKQGDDAETVLKTLVTLQGPSPDYFICEVRSDERGKITCSDIIFKKGDTDGVGIATVHWSQVEGDDQIKITARNVETPDVVVSFTVNLQVRTTE
jgi:hypothetical protein